MARKHHALYVPTSQDQAVADALGPGAAFLPVGEGFVYARPTGGVLTPVWALIDGVYAAFVGQAHALLRQRIRTTDPVTLLDRAVVAVAAKRVSEVLPGSQGGNSPVELRRLTPTATTGAVVLPSPMPLSAARSVLEQAARGMSSGQVHDDRPLFAALLDAGGAVLAAARNTAGHNRLRHAEVNLVLSWFERHELWPVGAVVVTSLSPCRMCAALLAHVSHDQVPVRYLVHDPGRLAQNTRLDALGLQEPLP